MATTEVNSMYESQRIQRRDGMFIDAAGQLGHDAEVREVQAVRLSQETMRQAQRAVVGLLAVPATVALSIAASVTWITAFLERGFESFQTSVAMFAERTDREAIVPTRGNEESR